MRILALVVVLTFAAAPSASAGASEAGPGWWTVFGSPELDGLVNRAMARSADVAQAQALLKAARARSRMAVAALLPEVRAVAFEGWQSGPLINAAGGEGQLLSASLDTRLDVDLSGGASRALAASRLEADAQAWMLKGVRQRIQVSVVDAYARVCELRSAEAAARAGVEARRSASELQTGLVKAGLSAAVDPGPAAAAAALRNAEQMHGEVRLQAAAAEAELGGLIDASTSELPSLNCTPLATPRAPPQATSRKLESAPQVAAARLRAEAAARRLKTARLSWMPVIRLTASDGYAAEDLRALFTGSAESLAVNALLSLPLLDGGRRKARVATAEAEVEAAEAEYRAAFVAAVWRTREVLLAAEQADQRVDRAQASVAEAAQALAAARSGAALGLVSRAALLNAEADAAATHVELAQARAGAVRNGAQAIVILQGDPVAVGEEAGGR